MGSTKGLVVGAVAAILAFAGIHVLNRGTDTSKTPAPAAKQGSPRPAPSFSPSVYIGWSYANDAGTPYYSPVASQALVDYAKADPLMSSGSPDLYEAILGRRFGLLVLENEVVANVRASTTYYFHVGTLT